jgi:hypothetical protein
MSTRSASKIALNLSAELWLDQDLERKHSVVVFFTEDADPSSSSQPRVALQLNRASIEHLAAEDSVLEIVLAESLMPLTR